MDLSLLFNDVPAWWVLLCLLLGLVYAWLLYGRDSILSPALRRLLFALRFLAVSLLALLLLSPLIRQRSRSVQKPLIVLAQDNSASILLDEKNRDWYLNQLPGNLQELEKSLESRYEVQSYRFSESMAPGLAPDFSGKQTDIGAVMEEISTRFAGRNLGAVVLLTDGIYNKGSNPLYAMKGIRAPLYTVALGDTLPRKDLLVASVDHNQIVFLGNEFRVRVNVEARGLAGSRSRLEVRHQGKPVHSRELELGEDPYRSSLPVDLKASSPGRQRYDISLQPLEGELSESNNSASIFVEVLDSRQKILLLAASPHPDLGAIKQALEKQEQYELDIRFLKDWAPSSLKDYSLVILHQLPSALPGNAGNPFEPLLKQQMPFWCIVGHQTSLQALNTSQRILQLSGFQGSYQESFAQSDPSFGLFHIPQAQERRLSVLPPLSVPLCEPQPQGAASVLFSQRIGSLNTERPLLLFSTGGGLRSAWLLGEGIWRWRLHDYRQHGDHEAVDELILKTVQYLATTEDKRRFRLRLPKSVFSENEAVTFSAELYNESYEAVNEPEVRMTITDHEGKNYTYTFSRSGNAYQLNAGMLPVGEYHYNARVQQGNGELQAEGSFVVSPQHAEELETRADHQLLYHMAQSSGGEMLYPQQLGELESLLAEKEEISPLVYEQDRFRELIDLKWLFLIVLALLSGEWFLRKRHGLY